MLLSDAARRVTGFAATTYVDKIRFFAWYLHEVKRLERIGVADIRRCFDELSMAGPANPTQLMNNLCKQNEALKDKRGYRLTNPARDALAARYAGRAETVEVDTLLSVLPTKLSGPAQDYLNEGLICFRHQAFRAAIVMTWNVAYDHLVTVVFNKHLDDFNKQMSGMFGGKRRAVVNRHDFQKLKESEVLEVCNAASIVAKEVAKVYDEKLDKRNTAAHPSGARFDKLQTEAYIRDLVVNGLLNVA